LSADGKICEGSSEQGDLAPNGGEMAPLCREIRQQRNASSISTVAEAALDVCGGLVTLWSFAAGGRAGPPKRGPCRSPDTPPATRVRANSARSTEEKTGRGSPPQSDDSKYLFANDPLWAVHDLRHRAVSRNTPSVSSRGPLHRSMWLCRIRCCAPQP